MHPWSVGRYVVLLPRAITDSEDFKFLSTVMKNEEETLVADANQQTRRNEARQTACSTVEASSVLSDKLCKRERVSGSLSFGPEAHVDMLQGVQAQGRGEG